MVDINDKMFCAACGRDCFDMGDRETIRFCDKPHCTRTGLMFLELFNLSKHTKVNTFFNNIKELSDTYEVSFDETVESLWNIKEDP